MRPIGSLWRQNWLKGMAACDQSFSIQFKLTGFFSSASCAVRVGSYGRLGAFRVRSRWGGDIGTNSPLALVHPMPRSCSVYGCWELTKHTWKAGRMHEAVGSVLVAKGEESCAMLSFVHMGAWELSRYCLGGVATLGPTVLLL
jgi:hypothetical protein